MRNIPVSRPEANEVHITSLIVQSAPHGVRAVAAVVDDMPDADVHRAEDSGKIVVLLETYTLGDVTERVDAIRKVPDVINVTLVYHQIENPELLDQPVSDADLQGVL